MQKADLVALSRPTLPNPALGPATDNEGGHKHSCSKLPPEEKCLLRESRSSRMPHHTAWESRLFKGVEVTEFEGGGDYEVCRRGE